MGNQTEDFPARLRRLRKERGISMNEFAKLANMTQPTIRNYELARNFPDIRKCEAMARVLDVTPAFLAYGVTP